MLLRCSCRAVSQGVSLYAQVPLLAITELRDIGMITVTIDTLRKDTIKIPIFACVKYMHG